MKFLHLADLHLGKRVNGFDMLEDQRFILEQILTLCEKHGVEARRHRGRHLRHAGAARRGLHAAGTGS